MKKLLLPILSVLLALALSPGVGAQEILGSWHLDVERSDDVAKTLQAQQGKKSRKQKKLEKAAAERAGKQSSNAKPREPAPLLSTTTLHISADGDRITIEPEQGAPLTVEPNGQAAAVSLSAWGEKNTAPVQLNSWEGNTLVMERALDSGQHIVQSYSVNNEGLLVQATEIRRPPAEAIRITRLFLPGLSASEADEIQADTESHRHPDREPMTK